MRDVIWNAIFLFCSGYSCVLGVILRTGLAGSYSLTLGVLAIQLKKLAVGMHKKNGVDIIELYDDTYAWLQVRDGAQG